LPALLRDEHPDAEEAFQKMVPSTHEQIGDPPPWKERVGHKSLVIEYVNTFTRMGER
jgi:hypothetical protein